MYCSMVSRSRPESCLRASTKRVWLKEELEGACGDVEAAALAVGELAAANPVDGDGDEVRLLDLKLLRIRSPRLSFTRGMEGPDKFNRQKKFPKEV